MLDFKNMDVWQRSHQLTLLIYRASADWPKDETFALVSQIRRAMASVPTNIAEGCGRNGKAELANFLNIAAGSASEVEYEIQLAFDLGYISPDQYRYFTSEIVQIRSMLCAYMKRLRSSS